MIEILFWLYWAYLATFAVKGFIWSKKREDTLDMVAAASSDDIERHLFGLWIWRYDYLDSHGSIWAYALVPWRKYDDLYPDKSFITIGATNPALERV